MSVLDIFSKRQKRRRGEVPDIYSYDEIPQELRIQVIHIWTDALGVEERQSYLGYHRLTRHQANIAKMYNLLVNTICREHAVLALTRNAANQSGMEQLCEFFLQEQNIEKVLDVVEMSFQMIDQYTRSYDYRGFRDASEIADNAIAELNSRFHEHGVGYQYVSGEIIRIDSQLLHVEAVKPALNLLNDPIYAGAQNEFLSAYEHYRSGKHKEALNDALKSFESTMKVICEKRKWTYSSNDTSKALIDICCKNGLVPVFWQQQMSALRSLLESGVPTGRNKLSGHGQGPVTVSVPKYIVSYVLHMTAAAIVFLANAEQELK